MSLLYMSFSGALLILAVTVIRALAVYRVPKKTFLILWGIALARLLIPFSVPSSFSVYTLFEKGEAIINNIGNAGTIDLGAAIHENSSVSSQTLIPHSEVAIPIWTIIWAIGALICATVFLITYWKCYKEFQTSLPVDNDFTRNWLYRHPIKRPLQIRQSQIVSAPLTFGVFRPVILMPKTTDWNDEKTLQYVLTHEFVHIRRFDSITKLILLIALCVHWFNPFVWVMYILANRDIELSCDETVLRLFGEHTKVSYAQMLICMEETKSGFIPFCNNFSKNAVEERMFAIMKTKKLTLFSTGLAICIIAGTATAFATSASAEVGNKIPTVMNSSTISSTVDGKASVDGKTPYVLEDGSTLDESAVSEQGFDVEWWTYEEYKNWLETQKKELPRMVGQKGRANGEQVVWTQEMVDEAIASYEKTLEEIKDGMLHSKTVNGSGDASLVIQTGEPAIQHLETDPEK